MRLQAARRAGDDPGLDTASARVPGMTIPASLWLESPYLPRAARRVAIRYSLPEQDVPDLLQELRIALLQTDPARRLNATWIFQTAAHKAVDVVRRRMRSPAAELDALDALDSSSCESSPPSSEREAELLHLLRARASLLPPKLKEFYALRYAQGLSQREIARRLGACRASVRWLDRQCVRLIRGHRRVAGK